MNQINQSTILLPSELVINGHLYKLAENMKVDEQTKYIFDVLKKYELNTKLTLSEKIKVTMLKNFEKKNLVSLDYLVEACHGSPCVFGFADEIARDLTMLFPDIIKNKMYKDSQKSKPRFNSYKDCFKQVVGEVTAAFNNKNYVDLYIPNIQGYELKKTLYCYAPEGIDHHTDEILENFIEELNETYFNTTVY